MNKKSWESLSSAFSNLEVSFSQDSSYASDEVSVVSSNPTTVDTAVVPNQEPLSGSSLYPLLKSILKKPQAEGEDAQSESGYGTDTSDYGYETISEGDEGDLCDLSVWDGDSDIMSEVESDDDIDFVGSFVTFESMVRFNPNVQYIEAPQIEEDEGADTGLTCHEIMETARSSGSLQLQDEETPAGIKFNDDIDDPRSACGAILNDPEEHPLDMVDIDRQLFVAYVNGIKGIVDSQYKARLRNLVDNIRQGQARSPYLEMDNTDGVYLDHALNHVIGVFRNLLVPEEFAELMALSEQKEAMAPRSAAMENHNTSLMDQIQRLLVERLAQGNVDIEPEELSFFAGGVTYALESQQH